jgi:hypothetical protein
MKTSTLFFAALVILLSACRKDRTCNCNVLTEGTTTTRNQTAGSYITIDPLPPIQVVAPIDTTIETPLNSSVEEKTIYHDTKVRTAKINCVPNYEVSISENDVQTIPGTATITTTQTGKKIYNCEIE